MSTVTLLAIDLAKTSFQLHGVDEVGRAAHRAKVSRAKLAESVARLAPRVVAMEACSGAHYWAKRFRAMGCEVRLIAAQFVKPFVRSNKNDAADAEAIAEAAQRPGMRFVAIKDDWQLEIQALHRVRSRLVAQRTALVNQVRGELSEFGIVWAKGVHNVRRLLPELLGSDEGLALSGRLRALLADLASELLDIDERIEKATEQIEAFAKENAACRRLAEIPGVGAITATALAVSCGSPTDFKNGRHFAAFLGLVPRHAGTGGKNRLGRISKRGDVYLRSLLVHGARAVVQHAGKRDDSKSRWATSLKERRGSNKAAVAVANKNARIAWALMAKGEGYKAA